MIYITGDTHGLVDFSKLNAYFKDKFVSYNDYLIILGDAGILWSDIDNHSKKYESLGLNILYIDGNHENFNMLEKLKVIEKFNARMHQVSEHIYHVIRGEIMCLNELTFLCLGGAKSIDKQRRIKNETWWKQENITNKDYKNALINLKKYDYKVDYVLSHCGPSSIIKEYFNNRIDNNTKILDKIKKVTTFSKWYFGHYHQDFKFNNQFRCFYDDIISLPKLNKGDIQIKQKVLIRNEDSIYSVNSKNEFDEIEKSTLPEWYYPIDKCYFISLKGIKEFEFENEKLKIVYDKSSLEVNYKEIDLYTLCLAIEKYDKKIDISILKMYSNYLIDEYNDSVSENFKIRHFNFQNKLNTDYKFQVLLGDNILSYFKSLDKAKDFVSEYINNYLYLAKVTCQIKQVKDLVVLTYDIGDNNIIIKEVR